MRLVLDTFDLGDYLFHSQMSKGGKTGVLVVPLSPSML